MKPVIINCLHLLHREDRLVSIKKQAAEQNFMLVIEYGTLDKHYPKRGITMGHKRSVQRAKDEGLSSTILCEDDCCFSSKGALDYFLQNTPEHFDLYMGTLYNGEIKEQRVMNGFSGGMTLFCIPENFYDYFLSIPDNVHCDLYLGETAFKHQYLVPPKFVCYQKGGWSDNIKKSMSYQAYHDKMDFFKG